MIVSNKLLYVALLKTGSTYIEDVLSNLPGTQQVHKNTQHIKPEKSLVKSDRTIVSSIRSPWSWYKSLWSYAVSYNRSGGVGEHLRKNKWYIKKRGWRATPLFAMQSFLNDYKRDPEIWRSCLDTHVDDVEAFRTWLHLMNNKRRWGDIGEGYSAHSLKHSCGYYTYKYLDLCTLENLKNISSLSDAQEFDKQFCYIDRFLRTENLAVDIADLLNFLKIEITDELLAKIHSHSKINPSKPQCIPLKEFYNEELSELVYGRDRLIFEKFGYSRTP